MIFFDLDGTLVNHDYAVKKALPIMLDRFSLNVKKSPDELYKIWMDTIEKYYDLYLEGKLTHSEQRIERMKGFFREFNVTLTENEVEELFNIYLNAYENNWSLYDDVIECLEKLKDKRLGVISNGYFKQQTDKLKRTNISKYFEILVTSSELDIAKPNKKIFEYACEKSNISISDCIYIGDRWKADALGSKSAGMRAIWLNRTKEYKDNREGIKVINNLSELALLEF